LVDGTGTFRLPIDAELGGSVRSSGAQQLVLGIRPEEVLLDGAESPDFEAIVVGREPLGDETIYDLQVGATGVANTNTADAALARW
jgi:ABC-type sugar transport system ATPase subunit